MKINVMSKGDKVLNVTSELLAIQRKNGEVDIIPLILDDSGVRIDTENIVTIGYGNNSVETEVIDGVVVTNFQEAIHMAGKKDNAVVAVISDLTQTQAAQMSKEIMKAKAKYAPHGRGTIASGLKSNVGSLIQSGRKRIGG